MGEGEARRGAAPADKQEETSGQESGQEAMGRKGLNPADAHRRAEKKKQIARNKKQRELQREARADKPEQLKAKLQDLLESEPTSLKRQVYQKAYEASFVKQAQLKREEAEEKKKKQESRAGEGRMASTASRHVAPLPPTQPQRPAPSWHSRQQQYRPPVPPVPQQQQPVSRENQVISAAPEMKIKRAETDAKLIAMVPASLRARKKIGKPMVTKEKRVSTGVAQQQQKSVDKAYMDFLGEMDGLGAFD